MPPSFAAVGTCMRENGVPSNSETSSKADEKEGFGLPVPENSIQETSSNSGCRPCMSWLVSDREMRTQSNKCVAEYIGRDAAQGPSAYAARIAPAWANHQILKASLQQTLASSMPGASAISASLENGLRQHHGTLRKFLFLPPETASSAGNDHKWH